MISVNAGDHTSPMLTRSVVELYEGVTERGFLTRAVELERVASYARFVAGIAAQPVIAPGGEVEPVSGFAPTIPERRGSTRRAGT